MDSDVAPLLPPAGAFTPPWNWVEEFTSAEAFEESSGGGGGSTGWVHVSVSNLGDTTGSRAGPVPKVGHRK